MIVILCGVAKFTTASSIAIVLLLGTRLKDMMRKDGQVSLIFAMFKITFPEPWDCRRKGQSITVWSASETSTAKCKI